MALELSVTAPPVPPLPEFALLPLAVISAFDSIVIAPVFLASIVTYPAFVPAPLVEVPPDVVISPPIIICPVVLALLGFLTAELIST